LNITKAHGLLLWPDSGLLDRLRGGLRGGLGFVFKLSHTSPHYTVENGVASVPVAAVVITTDHRSAATSISTTLVPKIPPVVLPSKVIVLLPATVSKILAVAPPSLATIDTPAIVPAPSAVTVVVLLVIVVPMNNIISAPEPVASGSVTACPAAAFRVLSPPVAIAKVAAVEFETGVIKPLVEVTGPENVVELIIKSSHASMAYLSACRQPGLSDTPDEPGTLLL
tara:strand:- start:7477 stop:8151 length:675 start_codon:yes stop_codon:yes gene_type:complete